MAGLLGYGLVSRPAAYLCLLWLAIALWIAVLLLARELGLRLVATTAGALIVLFALAPPLLSLDVFSYISYGRLGVEHGLNPYQHAPAAIPGDAAASRVVDYREAVSVYGPVFTLLSYPLAAAGVPFALWSLKAIAAAAIAATAWIVARLARRRGVDPAAATAFVALNPLVLVHLVGGAHNDALMVAIATAAVAAALTSRPALAGAGFVLAAAVKVSGLLYAPFALLGAAPARSRARMLAGAALAAALAGAISLAAFGPAIDAALTVAGENQDRISRWSVAATAARVSGIDVGPIRTLLAIGLAVALAGLAVAVARGLDWVRAAGWAALGVLVASAYIVPWYVLWVLPPAAISRDRALIGATILLTAFQAVNGVAVSP
ncbi:MAG: polyprenol phosphomannose-dependent alpha 1,6 mannosyltransferase MptB [Thermoleophilia bacterium]|nr:polyprenol phosphomannose-dependent alpha 1,6 mannosyltransferase MptB [Thermoleophilia bacterium]